MSDTNKQLFAGIDYGSKLAGTTVIAYRSDAGIAFAAPAPKQDADRFIVDWCRRHRPAQVFIDAPLSLPGVYRDLPNCDDYFYRQADRSLSAMSPMFLGGLTARAMKLRAALEAEGMMLYEVYPGGLASILQVDRAQYKKSKQFIPAVLETLTKHLPTPPAPGEVLTWHHFDALLAWLSGWRFRHGAHHKYGAADEGLIIV